MSISVFGRYALVSCMAWMLLAGCDNSLAPTPAFISSNMPQPAPAKVQHTFFVSYGASIEVFDNKSYGPINSITSGVNNSAGLWIDKAGNLYVANYSGPTVTEYAPGGNSPACTYSSRLVGPINVATDDAGNVYVYDNDDTYGYGYIDKFAQCRNTISKRYFVGEVGFVQGVAVDSRGDIFISCYCGSNEFEKFKNGSKTPTLLGALINIPRDIVIDKNRNLIAVSPGYVNGNPSSIWAVAPPYAYASAKLLVAYSGQNTSGLSLNKKENLLSSSNEVWANSYCHPPKHACGLVSVYSYPSGGLVKQFRVPYALGVAESPNATF
jgi:hypothetical protein